MCGYFHLMRFQIEIMTTACCIQCVDIKLYVIVWCANGGISMPAKIKWNSRWNNGKTGTNIKKTKSMFQKMFRINSTWNFTHRIVYCIVNVALLFRMLSASQIGILFQATDLRVFFFIVERSLLNWLAGRWNFPRAYIAASIIRIQFSVWSSHRPMLNV